MKPTLVCILLAVASISAGCNRRKVAVRQTEEQAEPAGPASELRMGDPRAAGRLLAGFHDIEANAWRWTARQFAVSLRIPPGAAERGGAVLVVRLTVPAPVIEAEKSITLSASIDGTKLASQTWSAPGNYVYQQPVSKDVMKGDSLRVDFELDKALPPNRHDPRELGIVVKLIALELK